MSKCIGCGSTLQDMNPSNPGYTTDLTKDYCIRCFRLKNYGEIYKDESIDENKIISKVNSKKNIIVFFLIDYLNINKTTIDIYNKIINNKVLVISKCDLIRIDTKYSKIKKWIKQVYDIKEDILFISNSHNNTNNTNNILNYMDKININTAYIMGITNSGKSTYLNKLLDKEKIVTSKYPNTTLDFIKLNIDGKVIYDTPGFKYSNIDTSNMKVIKPVSLVIKANSGLVINDLVLWFNKDNKVIFYGNNVKIKKIYKKSINLLNNYDIIINTDLVIPGIGFINIKNKDNILCNTPALEIRSSISSI